MELGSLIGFGQLGVFGVLAYFVVKKYGVDLTQADKMAAIWFIFDGLCHLIFEGAYVIFTIFGTVKASNALLALPWNEYAKSDFRWNLYDPGVLSLELLTVLLGGPLALFVAFTILTNNKWRHPLQLILCVCELYGGWMTFGPEWVSGSPNIDASNFTYMWLYLTIPNGAWVVIPIYLAWDSMVVIGEALEKVGGKKKTPRARSSAPAPAASPEPSSPAPVTKAPKSPTSAPRSPRGRAKKSD